VTIDVGGVWVVLAPAIVTGSRLMRLKSVLAAGALVAGGMLFPACGSTVSTAGFVASGDCPREQALVRRALDRSTLEADVNGDGRLDKVAVASDPGAPKPCRGFVGVRVQGGPTYSTHLIAEAVPIKGLRAQVVGLPRLGKAPRTEIVVDTKAAVDSLLAQMFTLADGALRAVKVPGFQDGTFIVEGGGVIYPYGTGCTATGQLVVSQAAQTRDGKQYHVTRRTYDVRGQAIRLVDPVVARATVPVDQLLQRFPEFGRQHWKACSGSAGV
jgi:hypothetical protein